MIKLWNKIKSFFSRPKNEWKEKLEALCNGLEMELVPQFLEKARVGDYKRIGDEISSSIKKLHENLKRSKDRVIPICPKCKKDCIQYQCVECGETFNDDYGILEIDLNSFIELKRLYNEAKPNSVFIFQGQELLREYAKYLIEYLQPKFKDK